MVAKCGRKNYRNSIGNSSSNSTKKTIKICTKSGRRHRTLIEL